jgi:hypothetical protein
LQRTAEPAREILEVEKIDVVADKGYFRTEDIASCEAAGLPPHVSRPQRGRAVKNGFFRKDEFRYDAERNAYICPAGQVLRPIREGKWRELKKVDYGNAKACRACPLRRCAKGARSVSRLENEDALDRMADRLKARPEILNRRREIVEHPFGSIKQWMNQGAFLMKGLDKVRAEFPTARLQSSAGAQHRRRRGDGRSRHENCLGYAQSQACLSYLPVAAANISDFAGQIAKNASRERLEADKR